MRPIVLAAALAAALPLGATRAAAQQHANHQPPKVSKDAPAAERHDASHAASGWKEMDAFHQLMMQTWHPAKSSNDLAPARAKAGAMADAARAWAAAAVPKGCDTPETRATVARLATDSRALADLVARAGSTDAQVRDALKALHDRFEPVEHGCRPAGHGAHGKH
jgi:hypothetical protein